MFVCPRCSAANPQDHRFCQQCGLKLVRRLAVILEQPLATGEPTDPQIDSEGNAPEQALNLPTGETSLRSRYPIVAEISYTLDDDLRLLEVLDSTPQESSPLQEFIKQQPMVDGKAYLGKSPMEYPEWELWESVGVAQAARPYLALQHSLTGIPQLWDAWEEYGRSIVVLNNLSNQPSLSQLCQDPQVADQEVVHWLDQSLRLWSHLEPWAVRASLLDLNNLRIAEDRSVALSYLIPEDIPVTLKNLAQQWQTLTASRWPQWSESMGSLADQPDLTVDRLRTSLQELSGPASSDLSSSDITDSLTQSYHLLGIDAAAATDVGQQREHNEDYYSISTQCKRSQDPQANSLEGRGLYILCDGMGGHAAGEVASRMVVNKLHNYWQKHWQDNLPSEEEILASIANANQAVYEINQTSAAAGNGRMGTTLVMVMVQDQQVAIAHVGDSRCYLLEESSRPVQVTLDHEVGQREILRGVEPEIAYGRPDAYQLTQAIGPRDWGSISPDVQFFGLRENTLILLASDGLTDQDLVEEHGEELLRPLIDRQMPLQEGVQNLVNFGNNYNGHDNITVIAVHIQVGK
jgi:protein phosphatase